MGGDFLNTSMIFRVADSNILAGVERGYFQVIPFFRGEEGDGTFKGFVLSN